jgi:hypothetical protein
MVSLKFPKYKISGHYILVVGKNNGKWIVNDPYKNFLTGSGDGYHCLYTAEEWKAHSKGYGLRFTGL